MLLVVSLGSVTEAAELIAAARSSIYRWLGWFEIDDVNGLRSLSLGPPVTTVTEEVIELLQDLMESTPREHGYLRTRWSSELLAKEIHRQGA